MWLYLFSCVPVASITSSSSWSITDDDEKVSSIDSDETVCTVEHPPINQQELDADRQNDQVDDSLFEVDNGSLTSFNPVGMKSYTLEFPDANLLLRLLQSYSAFDESGKDDTGLVLWGASVALSQFLLNDHQQNRIIPKGSTVLELGCGSAVPSLIVACTSEASRVIATDYRSATLAHVQYHSMINQHRPTSGDGPTQSERKRPAVIIETFMVDWEDGPSQERLIQRHTGYPDVIIAADVIYGVELVPVLVETIKRFLPRHGRLIVATRDGRLGIPEFLDLLKSDFHRIHIESYGEDNFQMPPIPKAIRDDIHSVGRYRGDHWIYVYEWKQGSLISTDE
jgi:predicted nicotinamide N-methyase